MSDHQRTIAIIGAGFSGTVVAANLLRQSHLQRVRILLFDRNQIARGTAYTERSHPYLLNVPAGRMSADSRQPLEFLDFARRTHPHATAEDFLPRALYGEYLEWKLRCAERSAAPGITLVRLHADVCGIRCGDGSRFTLQLADGRAFAAEEVVLAIGVPPPRNLPPLNAVLGSERYVDDPWRAPTALGVADTVLIVGTGLTMADIALSIASAAPGATRIHALSRHGWLPAAQSILPSVNCTAARERLLEAAGASIRQLYRAVRALAHGAQARGGSWHDAINCVRQCAPALWQRLAVSERQRFMRHLRALWDVHRHRLPQESAAALEELRRADLLHIHAGRLLSCEPCGRRLRVSWRPRGTAATSLLTVDRIINCSGASHDVNRLAAPLWHSLLAQGMISADPLGLGVRTGEHGSVLDVHGEPVRNLYYVGPMLQADYWEATAVVELRAHAEGLVRYLLAPQRDRSPPRRQVAAA